MGEREAQKIADAAQKIADGYAEGRLVDVRFTCGCRVTLRDGRFAGAGAGKGCGIDKATVDVVRRLTRAPEGGPTE